MPKNINDILNLDLLHYKESSSETEHNALGIGVLDINQVLKFKNKMFRKLAQGKVDRPPRLLVICDPTEARWSTQKVKDVELCLKVLLDAKYKIMVLNPNGMSLELLEKAEKFHSAANDNPVATFTASADELIKNDRRLKNKPITQIRILDTVAINTMLATAFEGYEIPQGLELNIGITLELESKGLPLKLIHETLNKSHPQGVRWLLQEADEPVIDQFIGMLDIAPKQCEIRLNKVNALLNDENNLHLGNFKFDPFEVNIVFSSIPDKGSAEKLFRKVKTHTKHIALTFEKINFEAYDIDVTELTDLSAIHLESCTHVDVILQKLLHALPTLQRLNITQCRDLSSDTLITVLSKTKALKALSLLQQDGVTLRLDNNVSLDLPNLTKVDFSQSTLPSNWISALFTTTTHLKEFDFTDATVITPKKGRITDLNLVTLGDHQYPIILNGDCNTNLIHLKPVMPKQFLENIDLTNIEISDRGMEDLLNSATLVKELDIQNAPLTNITINESVHYDALRDLKMSGNADDIENIVKRTTQLEKLGLRIIDSEMLSAQTEKHLSQVEHLEINTCKGIKPVLQVLANSRSLDSIYINLNDIKQLDPYSSRFKNVESYIDAHKDEINNSSVSALEVSCPHIQLIEFLTLIKSMRKLKMLTLSDLKNPDVNKRLTRSGASSLLAGLLDEVEYFRMESKAEIYLGSNLCLIMPHLKELQLEFQGYFFGADNMPSLMLPIETLSVTGEGHAMAYAIENLLNISPEIKNLQVKCQTSGLDTAPINVTKLEVLDISDGGFLNSRSLYSLLVQNPNVRVLKIRNRSDLNNFVLPPGLKHLELIDATGVNFDEEHFQLISDQVNGNIILSNKNTKPKDTVEGQNTEAKLSEDSSQNIRMNTELDNNTHHMTEYFIDKQGKRIDPLVYRESTANDIILKEGIFKRGESPFIWINKGDIQYRACPELIYVDEGLETIFSLITDKSPEMNFMGKKLLVLTGKPQRLPSLHANEVMTHISIPGLSRKDIVIQPSARDDFYYISSSDGKSKKVVVEYILKTPTTIELKTDDNYANENVPAVLPDKYQSGDAEYWKKALIDTKAGKCSHKTTAYFFEHQNTDTQIRPVSNQTHAYVEVLKTGEQYWQKIHLGGHPTKCIISGGEFAKKPVDGSLIDKSPIQIVDNLAINPAFSPDKHSKDDKREPKKYIFDLLSIYSKKNVFLNFKNNECLESFQQLARETAYHISRPVFYIDSPDDISCHAPRIMRDKDNKGTWDETPGGPLYDFLHAKHSQSPVIIVNFSRFSAEEIVRFNSIIDKNRIADREPIPTEATVTGLYNNHSQEAYRGTDFTSRFDVKLKPEFTAQTLNSCMHPKATAPEDLILPPVYLHQSPDWQSLLYGKWKLSSTGWSYQEGPLIEALESGQGLTLHDAPWDDRDFQNLMTRLRIDKTIEIYGKVYRVPSTFFIKEGPPYPIDDYAAKHVHVFKFEDGATLPADALVLNPVTFSQFFQQYHVEDNVLCSLDGHLAACKGGEKLSVYLSHEISDADWGRLVETAAKKNVLLKVYTQSGIKLPSAIAACIDDATTEKHHAPINSSLTFIKTNDVQGTIESNRGYLGSPIVLDCTGLQPSDLFGSITRASGSAVMNFVHTDSVIDNILKKGKNVALTGQISLELEQYLAHWAMTKKHDKATLYVIATKPMPSLTHVGEYGESNNSTVVRPRHIILSENADANNFIKQRSSLVKTALSRSPIVLITGPTGVGKSTFMLDHFSKDPGIELHNGLDSIDKWLTSPTVDKDITLFIDEANIAEDKKQDWAEFAALLLNKSSPTILWKGKVYPLTSRHKVVFAGNPHTYGGERYQPSLFRDYAIAQVEFKPINTPSLVSSVIQPVLGGLPEYKDINPLFVEAYNQVLGLSGSESLITPRELKHMAHLYLVYSKHHRGKPEDLARLCANTVVKQLLPQSMHARLPPAAGSLSMPTPAPMIGYCVTESRRPIESRLNEFLAIRDLKISDKKITGGLGGIVLEGDPGTGKSEHVVAQLVAQGYSEGSTHSREDRRFYRIPVSMGYAEKKALLCQAYQEGAIVIVDEINTSPAMERFFNDALSGTLELPITMPRTEVKPGFLLIGTQNSIKLEGRRSMSCAMMRRLMHCDVPPYNHDEMVQVLVDTHNVNRLLAHQIVSDFESASKTLTTPLPFRVLLKHYQEAVPFIAKTYAERSLLLPHNERMAFIQSLLVKPIPPTACPPAGMLLVNKKPPPVPIEQHVNVPPFKNN